MDRARRRRLAEELAAKVVSSRKDVVAVLLFGSVARGDDEPDSDVEIVAVVRRGGRDVQRFVLGGVLFNVYWRSAMEVRQSQLMPDADALRGGFVDTAVVLHDPHGWFARLRRDVKALPASFHRLSAEDALHQMYEYVCKARNAWRRKDDGNVVYATGTVGHFARVIVALLNRRHYASENTMGTEWRGFPDLPPHFGRDLSPLLSARASPRRRYTAAMALWRSTRAWAARRGVRLKGVTSLRQVRIAR